MLPILLPVVNQILAALPRADYRRLSPVLELVELTEGDILCETGATLRHVYFPTTCLLSLFTLVDGKEVFAVALVGRDGVSSVACALGTRLSPFRVVVLTSGMAMRVEVSAFVHEFHQCQAFRDAVLHHVLVLTLQISQNAACNRFHRIDARLSRWLLMVRDRLSSNHFHLTQHMLGDLLGVRRVGVTNAAHALKQRALIDYSRGAIDIVDGTGLQASACSCYHRLQGRHGYA